MNVLFIIETLAKGGAERALVNLIPELQKLNINCEVAILFPRDDLSSELELLGVKIHRFNLSNRWNAIRAFTYLRQLIKNRSYDVLHAHLFYAHFYIGLYTLYNRKIKTVVTFHNLTFNEHPANSIMKKVRKKVEEYLVKRFHGKTGVSFAVRQHYIYHLNLNNIDVIHNSFPIKQFEGIKTIRDWVNPKYTILTPGRFVEIKGHKYLFEAIEILNKKGYEFDFLIVGSGPLEKQLRDQANKIQNVRVIPELTHTDLMKLYNKSDLIVIPSTSEAFGLVVGEAMVMEVPVVASTIDGIVEIIDDRVDGLLFPPGNSTAMASTIEEIYKDRNLQNTIRNNGLVKIKKFDSSLISKQWKNYYDRLLGN